MGSQAQQPLPPNHQAVLDRFLAACQADERIVAATLNGSYARNAADAYSDLDLGLITTDAAYEEFWASRKAFMRWLGEPLFLETFALPNYVFFIFADGTEGELALGRVSQFDTMHTGPYRLLLDKKGLLAGIVSLGQEAPPAEQVETLRRQIAYFWHELSHFITALGRGQLWWAYGQLEALRHLCLNLARLQQNFADTGVGDEPYFKIEQAIPIEQLAPLQTTFCSMEPEDMRQAALAILRFYKELAPPLAQAHGITYPAELERLIADRLEKLDDVSSA